MKERFAGTLTFREGESAKAEIQVDDQTLSITAGGSEVGSWPLKYCRVTRVGSDVFRLTIDGEVVRFAPLDPEAFGVNAAMRFKASSLADRIGALRDVEPDRPSAEGPTPGARKLIRSALGALAIFAVVALAVAGIGWWDEVATSPPSTTTFPTTTVAPLVDIFSQAPPVFASRWNAVADDLNAPLQIRGRIPTGRFEARLSPRVILQGTIDDGGALSSIVMSADPSGDAEEDQLVVAAWGVAIAVAEPDLDAAGRRKLLRDLGLDVDDPQLENLDGELDRGDHRYVLRYLPEFKSILFTVSEL